MIYIAFDYNYVKMYIEEFGYKLISDTYKNIREKLIRIPYLEFKNIETILTQKII